VVVGLPNGKRLLQHYFAILSIGAVPGLIPPDTPSQRVAEIITATGARSFIGCRSLTELADASISQKFAGCHVHLFPNSEARMKIGETVLHTSGTSGFSSGCVFDFNALLENAKKHIESIGQTKEDIVLVTLPQFYSFAFVAQTLGALVSGSQLVLAPPPFTPHQYCRTIDEHGVSVSSLTPTLVRLLLEKRITIPGGLRVLTVGGDVLAEKHVVEILRRWRHLELYVTYGLTQAGPRVSTFAAYREPAARFGSVGLPLRGVEVSINRCGAGNEGELVVASDTLMRRRIGFGEGRLTDDWTEAGHLATGDIFRQDDDGYLYFQGRRNDFVSFNGEKICLASIRRIANTIPHVLNTGVRCQSMTTGRDELELSLTVDAGAVLTEESIMRHLKTRLRPAERPTRVHLLSRSESLSYK
jgi:acyl-coenzyme A synthetase/AMP-(fatty) acid ligase